MKILLITISLLLIMTGCVPRESIVFDTESPSHEASALESPSASSIEIPTTPEATTTMVKTHDTMPVNSNGNTINNGSFFEYDGVLFGRILPAWMLSVRDGDGHFYLSAKNLLTGETTFLDTSSDIGNVIVYDDYIYYHDLDIAHPYADSLFHNIDSGAIYRCKLDGTDKERLTDALVTCFYIYDGKIYYQVGSYEIGSDGHGRPGTAQTVIYSMSLKGENCSLVYDSGIGDPSSCSFSIYDGFLYLSKGTNKGLISVNIDDGSITDYTPFIFASEYGIAFILDIIPTESIIYFQGVVYIDDFSQPPFLFSLDKESGAVQQVVPEEVTAWNLNGDYVYYASVDGYIKRFSLVDSNKIIVCQSPIAGDINIIDGSIYFREEYRSSNTFYSVPDDGIERFNTGKPLYP